MSNTAKFRINAEEIRLTNSRRMLIASMDRVTERLENRLFALSASEVDRLNRLLENIQNRLAEIAVLKQVDIVFEHIVVHNLLVYKVYIGRTPIVIGNGIFIIIA